MKYFFGVFIFTHESFFIGKTSLSRDEFENQWRKHSSVSDDDAEDEPYFFPHEDGPAVDTWEHYTNYKLYYTESQALGEAKRMAKKCQQYENRCIGKRTAKKRKRIQYNVTARNKHKLMDDLLRRSLSDLTKTIDAEILKELTNA